MNIAYYPGCSGQGSSMEYERSTRAVCAALGIVLEEIPDWSCCGSSPAHACDHVLSAALCARNLNIAAANGGQKVATPCPSCLANLKTARARMQDPEFRAKVDALMDEPCCQDLPDTVSVLQVIVEDFGLDALERRAFKKLEGLRVAPYYGCLMSRPKGIMQFDDPENPMALDNIMTALGAEVVPFPLKTECCGAALGIPRRDIMARLTGRLLRTAQLNGADAIVVACPLCQMNLDLRQEQAAKALGASFNIPVLYYTQFIGLALGLPNDQLGLDKLSVSPAALLQKLQPKAPEAAKAEEVSA